MALLDFIRVLYNKDMQIKGEIEKAQREINSLNLRKQLVLKENERDILASSLTRLRENGNAQDLDSEGQEASLPSRAKTRPRKERKSSKLQPK